MNRIIIFTLLVLSMNCVSQNIESQETDTIAIKFKGVFEYD